MRLRLIIYLFCFVAFFGCCWGLEATVLNDEFDPGIYLRPVPMPVALGVSGQGSLYIVDAGNARIQKFNTSGDFLSEWGDLGTGDGQFNGPNGVAVDKNGNVYIADTYNNRVQKFDPAGRFLAKWGGQGTREGQFNLPYSVTVGPDGNVYVADTYNHRIQKFDPAGRFLAKWSGASDKAYLFNDIYNIVVDSQNDFYVTDTFARSVQIEKFDRDWHLMKVITGTDTASFVAFQFNMTVDNRGNIYTTDSTDQVIKKFDPDGRFLTNIIPPHMKDPINDPYISRTYSLTIDRNNNLYIAEAGNSLIEKMNDQGQPVANWRVQSGLYLWVWILIVVPTIVITGVVSIFIFKKIRNKRAGKSRYAQ